MIRIGLPVNYQGSQDRVRGTEWTYDGICACDRCGLGRAGRRRLKGRGEHEGLVMRHVHPDSFSILTEDQEGVTS